MAVSLLRSADREISGGKRVAASSYCANLSVTRGCERGQADHPLNNVRPCLLTFSDQTSSRRFSHRFAHSCPHGLIFSWKLLAFGRPSLTAHPFYSTRIHQNKHHTLDRKAKGKSPEGGCWCGSSGVKPLVLSTVAQSKQWGNTNEATVPLRTSAMPFK